jgi:1-acyl-sn-glycerol-3-phosphate acyltransferase
MFSYSPLLISQSFLAATGTRLFLHHQDRIPEASAVLVVSNHRSFMDAPVLMASVGQPIRFACHHYMSQVPILREFVTRLGCFPLDEPGQGQQRFFNQATQLLQAQQMVGVFPEGGKPMVKLTQADQMQKFHKGFAHLALRSPVKELAILPVAIASVEETVNSAFPLKLLSLFDPSEPLFDQPGWHPLVIYRRVNVLIGRPCWITQQEREKYHGKQAKAVVAQITQHCQTEIGQLLHQGCY